MLSGFGLLLVPTTNKPRATLKKGEGGGILESALSAYFPNNLKT